MRTRSGPPISRPTARASSAGPMTTRFGCGTRRAARSSWSCAAMRILSWPPGSRRMARASSAAPMTTRFGCGTRRAARSCWSCAAMRAGLCRRVLAGWRAHRQRVRDETVRVWDAASGKELLVLRGHGDWVYAAGFSPDGARIVSGSDDETVRVWDAASGEELLVLRGHEGSVIGRRVLARWRAHRQRLRRQHGSGVGRGERQGAAWSCAAMRVASMPPVLAGWRAHRQRVR